MTTTSPVVAREGRIVTVTFNEPENGNRLTPPVLATLAAVMGELVDDQDAQVVIITGSGTEFFSSGILSPAIRRQLAKDEIVRLVLQANRLYDAIEGLPQIVIAALNGEARAGAAELCLACDIRLAAENASFRLPEASWGGFPGAGGPVRLPALVGRARALEIMCSGRQVLAPEMEQVGLALAVHPAERLMIEARALAELITTNGPLATRGAKRIVNARLDSQRRARCPMHSALQSNGAKTSTRARQRTLKVALRVSRGADDG